MRMRDILSMAVHNLRQRWARTLLNLIGIVVGCIVVLMTLAGVRGVKETLHVLFDSSETARQIGILSGNLPTGDPPEDAIRVEGKMSEDRRERIAMQLENVWRNENRKDEPWRIDNAAIRQISELPHVVSIVPDVYVRCTVGVVGEEPRIANAISGVAPDSGLVAARILTGEPLSTKVGEEVLIDEFLAYRLGYKSDADLARLVGKELEVQYSLAPPRNSQIFNMLIEKWGELSMQELAQQQQFVATLAKLMADLDSTSLTTEEKEQIRSLLKSDQAKASELPRNVTRVLEIKGVVREGDADGLARLFRGHWQGGDGGVTVHTELANAIWSETSPDSMYYDAIVTADSTQHLRDLSDTLEGIGARTLSAVRIIESMEESVDESAWVVLGIAAAILATAGIGISNTLLISVLERTPEFGILKSVGAKNATLLGMMVCEGAILGLVGALIAVVSSFLIAAGGQGLLEAYLEYRLGGDIASVLFRFTPFSILLVTAISITICVVASIMPAWRAARLDPIVAMRRT